MLLESNPALAFLEELQKLREYTERIEDGRLDGACCVQTIDSIEDSFRSLWGYKPREEE